jgi:hypothetical protein
MWRKTSETSPREPRWSPRKRRRFLYAVGAALTVAALAFPYDLTVDTGWRPLRLTRVKTGIYQTSDPDEPTRVLYMEGCTVPAEDTRVKVKVGWTFGRMQMADVVFPGGERCSAAIIFGTKPEDQGVLRTASVGRRDTTHA